MLTEKVVSGLLSSLVTIHVSQPPEPLKPWLHRSAGQDKPVVRCVPLAAATRRTFSYNACIAEDPEKNEYDKHPP